VSESETILQSLDRLHDGMKENRALLNDVVGRLNELEADIEFIREEVKSQGVALAALHESRRLASTSRRGMLTPLPDICKEASDGKG